MTPSQMLTALSVFPINQPAATIQGFRDNGVLFAFFHRILLTILFRLGKKWDSSLYLCISERLLPAVKGVKGQTQTFHGEARLHGESRHHPSHPSPNRMSYGRGVT